MRKLTITEVERFYTAFVDEIADALGVEEDHDYQALELELARTWDALKAVGDDA